MSSRIGILGGSGQVGIEMVQLARARGALVSTPRSSELDIADAAAVERWVGGTPLDAIVNCAAYTAVEAAEGDATRAFAVNAAGPGHLGRACAAARVPVLHLSTDFVFSGDKTEPYDEDDEARPVNVYGASKLAGERTLLESGGDALVLRVSWVFSAHRANFVKAVLKRAMAGDALEVVDDQVGGPCGARGIAEAVWALIGKLHGRGPGLYHFEAVPHVSRYEFAKVILTCARDASLIERIPRIAAVKTTQAPGATRRPLNSSLCGEKIKRDFGVQPHDWRAELAQVISRLAIDAAAGAKSTR
jgi:dTDP-4-dehydrorhamnose reductase